MAKFCMNCGTKMEDSQQFCPNCGTGHSGSGVTNTSSSSTAKSRLTAGLLGVFLGGLGIHNFYLGNSGRAIAQIIVSVFTCGIGCFWGIIEGILILTGKIDTDADGNPLVD